ncbi:MAG: hypothetical protein OXM55_04650 [Bdellovibrionales bacterium]|nr:hypothetical protein [Bdellovibrionales bacterium]
MKKIALILSICFIAGSAGAYIDYTGKYRPVLELTGDLKKNKFKITQHKRSLYNEVYNITVPSSFYLPEYSASDQSFCEQALAKQNADFTKCNQQYPDPSDPNRDKCHSGVESQYPKKCLSDHSFGLNINVLTAKGKTKKYKNSPEVVPVASIDLIAYDSKEKISPNNVDYPKTNPVVMGEGEASSWNVILRKNYKNYYCIWARITLPARSSYMAHMSEFLVDFQKQVSDGTLTLPGDFTSTWNYGTWLSTLGDKTAPRRILLEAKLRTCLVNLDARTRWHALPATIISQCTLPIGSKLRRQFIIEDFMASKGFSHNRQYFKDDQVAPIYLRIVREDNLVCRTNPWVDLHGNNANLRDFPLKTNL